MSCDYDDVDVMCKGNEAYPVCKSDLGKKNRSSDVGGLGQSVHCGGSRSFTSWQRKLVTHKKGDKFTCKKAEYVSQNVEGLSREASTHNEEGEGSAENLSRIDEGKLWRQATGGAKHGSVYGFGPQEQAASLGVNISPLPTLSFQRPSICKEDVQTMIQESMLTERRRNDERFISGMSYMNDMFTQWSVTHTGVRPPLFVLPSDMVLFSSQIPTPQYPSIPNLIPYYSSIPNPNPYYPSTPNHPPNPVPCANEVHENDLVVEGDQGVEGDHQDVEGDHQGDDQNDGDYVSDYGSQ
ncbi:hypothetical protein Dimus_016614 [Dionaea muscipula]